MGNRTAYGYDELNRQTSLTDPFGNLTRYGYGSSTEYTLDPSTSLRAGLNAGLTQVLAAESDTYLYGLDRIGESDASGWGYHLPDALGSVRQLTDPGAGLTATQSYAPFGSVLSARGDGTSAYGFAGEWQDATGLVHLRARYYSPGMGRFFQVDPWDGVVEQPGTLNPYTYALNSPITHTDPSGNLPLCDSQIVESGSGACFIEIYIGIVIRIPIPCSWLRWWNGSAQDPTEIPKKATPTPNLSIYYSMP